jgi:hypothetical protein
MWVPVAEAISEDVWADRDFRIEGEPSWQARGSDRTVVEESGLIELVTRCSSESEFIERFASFATETDVVVPALPHVSVGAAGPFVIRLKDQTVLMRGRCEVTEIRPVAGAGAVRSLMRMRLREMDAHTCGLHIRLMERRAASSQPPEARMTGTAFALPTSPFGDPDRPDRIRRIARRSAPFAAGVLVVSLLAIVLRPGPKAARPVAAPSAVQAAATAPPTAPAPGHEIQTAPPRDCVARVTTTPAGATVLWGGIALGSSPIENAAIPCGTATVTLHHDRYSEVTRKITSERGQSTVLAERLSRPPATLLVTSSPDNALIKLNGRPVGRAPRKISTMRFEHVRIEASLPGYQPWKKTLFLKEAEPTVDVALVRTAQLDSRTGTARSGLLARVTPR